MPLNRGVTSPRTRSEMARLVLSCAGKSADAPMRPLSDKVQLLCVANRRPNRDRDSERGATLVEFALISPLLFVMLFGIVELGLGLRDQLTMSNAVTSGARIGSVTGTKTADIVILDAVEARLVGGTTATSSRRSSSTSRRRRDLDGEREPLHLRSCRPLVCVESVPGPGGRWLQVSGPGELAAHSDRHAPDAGHPRSTHRIDHNWMATLIPFMSRPPTGR